MIGTIRTQNPTITLDNGLENFGFYSDEIDDSAFIPTASSLPAAPVIPPPANWIELRPAVSKPPITTEYIPPAEYEVHSYPSNNYFYSHSSPTILPRVNITDYQAYPPDYDDDDDDDVSLDRLNEEYNDELDNFQLQPFRRADTHLPHVPRIDTSTESFGGNYLNLIPKSILKSGSSTTPPPLLPPITLDLLPGSYSPQEFDYHSTSPRTSVKINTDESIPIDYPTSAIERIIPPDSRFPRTFTSSSSSSPSPPPAPSTQPHRMRFASVSQLNDIEWEVPSEFQTIVYDLTDDHQQYRGVVLYNSSQNLNLNNNNNNDDKKSSHRKRSQSAGVEQKPYVSRVFVPWDSQFNMTPTLQLSKKTEQNDRSQQQAFEY